MPLLLTITCSFTMDADFFLRYLSLSYHVFEKSKVFPMKRLFPDKKTNGRKFLFVALFFDWFYNNSDKGIFPRLNKGVIV